MTVLRPRFLVSEHGRLQGPLDVPELIWSEAISLSPLPDSAPAIPCIRGKIPESVMPSWACNGYF